MKAKITPSSMLIYDEPLVTPNSLNKDTAKLKGNFEKKILIISDVLPPESEENILLEKMLSATGLSQNDIYHLELDDKKPILPLIAQLSPAQIICFGAFLDSPSVTFSTQAYKVVMINDYQLLITNTLSKISADSKLKQALWNGLKKMFEL